MEHEDHWLMHFKGNSDHRGDLSFIEAGKDIPFEIKRVYYLYNIPLNSTRGAHAHKNLKQILIALKGSVEVSLNDGKKQKNYILNSPKQGLYIGNMLWRELINFSSDAVCLVLASEFYDESDYIRNYNDFLDHVRLYA